MNFCFANLVGSIRWTVMKLYSGSKKLCSTCSANIRPVHQTLPQIGWEQSSPVDKEEGKIHMDDASVSILRLLPRELPYLLTCGRRDLVSGDPEWYSSWITLWEMIKVSWPDLTLAYILDHAVCSISASASWGRTLHLIISQLRMKHSSSNCLNQCSECLKLSEVKIQLRNKL